MPAFNVEDGVEKRFCLAVLMNTFPSMPNPAAVVAAERTVLRVPSLPNWIEPTVEYLKEKAVLCGACAATRARKLVVALQEALSNSIVHGNLEITSDLKERSDDAFTQALAVRAADPHYSSRLVEILTEYDGERYRWVLTDQGKGFDVEAVRRRHAEEPEAILSSGRGILMMHAFLDEVRYELGGRRVILTLNQETAQAQRRQVRQPIQERVEVVPVGQDGAVDWQAAHEAVAHDLSAEGIGILQSGLAVNDRILVG